MHSESPGSCPSASPAPSVTSSRGNLTDRHGRIFSYVRIALTDHCNLRCVYCMPEEGVAFTPNDRMLSTDEVIRLVRVAASLGVDKVRYTGGEPLLRKDLVEIVAETSATDGIESVHLTTNGILLPRVAGRLRDAGLSGLNISLDTLDPDRFQKLTRRTGLETVLESIRLAVRLRFGVKVNAVAMRGFNDDELGAFAELTRNDPITVRFIELMPFDAHQIWKTGRFFRADWIVDALREAFPDLETADGSSTEHHVFRVPGHAGKLAVIPAYTRSLCGACNRVRITADGKIRNCLYAQDEFDLMDGLRHGASDDDLADVLRDAMGRKPADGWAAQRGVHTAKDRISMTQIGG